MMSKQESDTRDKIITSAYKVLAEQGYDKCSMKEIAREAGVAQGLINYYFASKDDLLLELFKRESDRYCSEMVKVTAFPMNKDIILNSILYASQLVEKLPDSHRLRYELFAIGLRSDKGRKAISHCFDQGRQTVIAAMDRLPISEKINKQALSSIVVAALDGLSLQKMSDPNFDADAAYKMLASILETYMIATQ
jgi:AcrR family transcriptional regulator